MGPATTTGRSTPCPPRAPLWRRLRLAAVGDRHEPASPPAPPKTRVTDADHVDGSRGLVPPCLGGCPPAIGRSGPHLTSTADGKLGRTSTREGSTTHALDGKKTNDNENRGGTWTRSATWRNRALECSPRQRPACCRPRDHANRPADRRHERLHR